MKKLAFLLALLVAVSSFGLSTHGPDKNAYQQKSFVLQSDSISIAGANPGVGSSLKLFDLPAGHVLFHGCVVDVLATAGTNYLVTGQNLNVAVGTTANANSAWAAGETNLGFVATAFTSGVTRSQVQLDGPVRIDGSATAADIYLNLYTTNALVTNAAVTVVGTVTVTYSILGDD